MVNTKHYTFALLRGDTALVGEQLLRIIRSWSALAKWQSSQSAKTQYAIGFIRYDGSIYFGIFAKLVRKPTKLLYDQSPFTMQHIKRESLKQYRKSIHIIQRHLAIGDIYQANYCYQITGQTTASPRQLLYQFHHLQPTPYGAFISTPQFHLVSNSPELGLAINGDQIECRPMKGTRSRAAGMREQLLTSTKDQAELDMITDVVRNDLAQFALPGSVTVKARRQIVGYKTVWQAQAIIQAKRPLTTSTITVLKAILPYASITGAPKKRAIEILNQVEAKPRDIYCGAIGYIHGKHQAEFNVAIRTVVLRDGKFTYGVGGGITLDSDVQEEYKETLTKAAILLRNDHAHIHQR